jgi:hypothetical protein
MKEKPVVTMNGKTYPIESWELLQIAGITAPILRHSAIQRLALETRIEIEELRLIINPATSNGQKCAFLALGTNAENRKAFATGEADPSSLQPGHTFTRYPVLIAARRAIDRLILDLLGLTECHSELEVASSWVAVAPSPSARAEETGDPSSDEPLPPAESTGSSNGNSQLPPTEKQLGYLLTLATKGNLRPEEIEQLMATVNTRAEASSAIQQLRNVA